MSDTYTTTTTTATYTLPPPQHLPVGSIVTLRRRGHSRTNGEDYFAPAIVLAQFEPNGEIETLIFDSSSGVCFDHAYAIRDVSSRGDGQTRELYVERENIQAVLYDPVEFALSLRRSHALNFAIEQLLGTVSNLSQRLTAIEKDLTATEPPTVATAATAPVDYGEAPRNGPVGKPIQPPLSSPSKKG